MKIYLKRNFGLVQQLILLLMLSLIFCAGPAAARAAAAVPKYVTVPVYYLTDRNSTGDGYGNRRRYPEQCLHQMYYGTAFVTIENHRRIEPDEQSNSLGWAFTEEHQKNKRNNDQIDPSQARLSGQQFFLRLKNAMDQAHTSDLCIYVHGAAEGFEDACQDAAELAYALHRPLVLYSWPSEPKLLDYVVDNGNSEWSQGHFNLFCQHLHTFGQSHPLHITFLAHSMGNRFLFRSLHLLYQDQLVSDCEFISPDMDFDTCRHYLMGLRKYYYPAALRLYVSNKDEMLKLSQKLFGGYARLGEDVNSRLFPGKDVEELVVRKNNVRKKEESSQSAVEPVENNEENVAGNALERIDFTAIDKGLTGHSIPFQLVADMVDGKKPEGIELVEDKSDNDRPLKTARPKVPDAVPAKRN